MAEAREKAFSISRTADVGGDAVAKQSTVPLPPARRLGHASSAPAAGPRSACYTIGCGNSSADHLVERWIASLRSQ